LDGVSHDISNIVARATDGSGATLNIHLVNHMSISASGEVNIFSSCN